MKQKDIFLIVVVVIVSGTLSFVLSNILFGNQKKNIVQAEVVEAITSDFNEPDKRYFNKDSVDPTQNISIGENSNTQPFSENN